MEQVNVLMRDNGTINKITRFLIRYYNTNRAIILDLITSHSDEYFSGSDTAYKMHISLKVSYVYTEK